MTKIFIIALLLIQPLAQGQQPSRPTNPDDPMPPPDMDYFLGAWSFDWNAPESPLGPAGKLKGTEKYSKSGGKYQSVIEADGPEGDVKGSALTSYDEKNKKVTRTQTGLFGTSITMSGPIGGDLGGYYTIFWESEPIRKNGKTIILKGKTMMLSPANYRMQMRISVDGGPFTNFGNPWFTKIEEKSSPKR